MPPFYVIGHKNPDTDAICSAIGYAALLQATGMQPNAVAARCGEVSQRTRWVLQRSGIELPKLLTDVRTNAGMICHHYPKLLDGEWRDRALQLAAKTFELTTFLADVAGLERGDHPPVSLPSVTYHDSCAGLRELGVREQPRKLLRELCNAEVKELQQTEVCCGFGGTFCAKMPEISGKMVDDKLNNALATEADILAGGDLGCLLNIAGRARRLGKDIEVRHVAELLAGDLDGPGIGEGA